MPMAHRLDMAQPDTGADEVYNRLQDEFRKGDPKASGYLSAYSFFLERALVLEVLGAVQGAVVDLACGSGLVTLPLVRAGRRIIGVDFNSAACGQARRSGLHVIRGDAFGLPLVDNVAEAVVNVEFAQQYGLEAVECMLREAVRILHSGGRLVIVWSNRRALIHRLAGTVLRVLNRLRGRTWFPALTHHRPQDVQAAAARAGLATERMFAVFPPFGLSFHGTDSPLVSLIGSSFIAVFRKPAGPGVRVMKCP